MKHAILLAVTVLIGGMNIPTTVFAQESCGSIIEYYDYGEGPVIDSETPIEDCGNPFGIAEVDPALVVTYGETVLEGGSTYAFLDGVTHPWNITGYTSEYAEGVLYLHNGSDYILKQHIPNGESYRFTEAGTYTFVVSEMYSPVMTRGGTFERLRELLIPTALASYIGPALAVTFTVTEPTAEPVGISNILFLPGIQASRLYMQENGEEEKLWEPFGNNDLNNLAMSDTGESINDVYTKDVIDKIFGGGDIYKHFLTFLGDINGDSGPMVRAFPYDWRYDVFDIVERGTKDDSGLMKKPIETIEYLSALSSTDKVTIIAHSNGGLLAKAIMLKLEEEGKSNLVDKVIFIGTPHIGTPKALATVLHGYDQEHVLGLITDDVVARSVMKNMPGVYGLLPSEVYVESLTEPFISFDESETTALYKDQYGFTITNSTEYTNFLNGVEGRTEAGNHINEPSKTNALMLGESLRKHRELDTWQAPEGVEVFNIVGTGLATPKAIEYREFDGVRCYIGYQCRREKEIEPLLYFTGYGDQTVVSKSAGFLNTNIFYIDLSKIEGFKHANITETGVTQALVDHVLHGSSTSEIDLVSSLEPKVSVDLEIISLHSPARLYLRDSIGNVTGRITKDGEWMTEINGSTYLEAGSVKYVLVPKGISYQVVIEGEGSGVFTLITSELQNETQQIMHTFTATTSTTTVATFEKANGEFSTVTIDEDGDGIADIEMTVDGSVIEHDVTYNDLRSAVLNLNLSQSHKKALLQLIKNAEKAHLHKKNVMHAHAEHALLVVLKKTIMWYEQKKIITTHESDRVEKIIDSLVKQIVWIKKEK